MIVRALGIVVACLLAIQPWGTAQAFTVGVAEIELEPYAKGGTIAWDELQGIGGHKSLVALGINALARFDRLGLGFNFENWWLGEKLDDDAGIIPNEGRRFYADLRYGFRPTESLELYPFAGLGYEHWSRDDAVNAWNSINFPYAAIGGGAEYEHCYAKIGLLMPFAATANVGPNPTSRIGVTADAGLRLFNFTVGVFFRSVGFEDPDAKMVQAGVMLGYRFK
ncbi:MAG TPA: hypothetical protein PKA61_06210 [Nitrospira sp.]|nr:hypothetical protein [Nitrospira sp.]